MVQNLNSVTWREIRGLNYQMHKLGMQTLTLTRPSPALTRALQKCKHNGVVHNGTRYQPKHFHKFRSCAQFPPGPNGTSCTPGAGSGSGAGRAAEPVGAGRDGNWRWPQSPPPGIPSLLPRRHTDKNFQTAFILMNGWKIRGCRWILGSGLGCLLCPDRSATKQVLIHPWLGGPGAAPRSGRGMCAGYVAVTRSRRGSAYKQKARGAWGPGV